ncbi:hypothetical protein HHL24_04395 [Paraburkholderia sp. RP-4-7]|uniref:OTU domain-containing protein n=1 Tax=Paraburkholderia polaris TaxID=2728848 RepID=A0A848I4C7_9BURK|nr:hypothetical protein [Paraburkholderia polaris]NML97197.1 hypothetical protein [Paraburkholderia polaris]
MKNREIVVYAAEVAVGRERVSVRLLVREALMLLERELIQADGTCFIHSVSVDVHATTYDYLTADPYFAQLERHYSAIQEKIRQLASQEE